MAKKSISFEFIQYGYNSLTMSIQIRVRGSECTDQRILNSSQITMTEDVSSDDAL